MMGTTLISTKQQAARTPLGRWQCGSSVPNCPHCNTFLAGAETGLTLTLPTEFQFGTDQLTGTLLPFLEIHQVGINLRFHAMLAQ